ncbi:glycine zipper family protein [Flavobacterium haoranii]|uniref:Glycine zipper n=1 Tax=Flavobacterium haoranii TaxID=683124 RepID=A0A1M6L3P0_9FLAO|nr:glycine zipper family protein [Flavobacterium haoranii]SHJ65669.1 hypothetical protein SAMN05444337_2374 [Flavobacterium haoranii]
MKNLGVLLVAVLSFISCKNTDKSSDELAKEATIDSIKMEMEKQRIIDSVQRAEQEKVVYVNQNTTTTTERKGWSNTAKGAVIGAGVGAATGPIVSKKKGEGAIIGGLAGAGIGAGTGAIIDGKKK